MSADGLATSVAGAYVDRLTSLWGSAPHPVDTLFGAASMADVARRAKQRNAAWATLAAFAVLALIVARTLYYITW